MSKAEEDLASHGSIIDKYVWSSVAMITIPEIVPNDDGEKPKQYKKEKNPQLLVVNILKLVTKSQSLIL